MPKKEKEAPREAKPQTQYPFDQYEKIYRDICNEVADLIGEVEHESQWLQQHCRDLFANDFWERDPPDLVELRNALERTRNQLRRESYSLLYGSKQTKYFYGDISEDELNN
jgi:hypothetical protein